jgi:sulfur-carrier protein adenylyltransferase/sulfurtransferase
MGVENSLTELEKKRYKLQIMLPGIGQAGQEKIKNARVLVVGIGGLGSQILQYLTAMGVGTIGFIDFDVIEEENLSHQVLYGMKDIGKLKAVITGERLTGMNPLTRFNMLNVELTRDNGEKIIRGYDIVVDATNKLDSHLVINDLCIEHGKVMVYGCLCNLEGRISVFNYRNGPSFRCAGSIVTENNSHSGDGSGIPGILPGITGAFQSNEVLKIITGIPDVLTGKLMVIDIMKYNFHLLEIKRDPSNFNPDLIKAKYNKQL